MLAMWLDDGALGETRAGSMRSSGLWGTVHVWPPRGGTPFTLAGHESEIGAVAVDPNSRRVAAGAADGTVRVWPVDWDLLIDQLRSATTACLEPAERERLLGESPTEAVARFGECERRNGRS
jgi:WD40 repeat protein